MLKKLNKIFIIIFISIFIINCAGNNRYASDTGFSKLEDGQLVTYDIMEDKGYLTKTKSPNTALGLSFIPMVGTIYAGNYKSSFLDILFYPYTLLFMPYINYNHTQYETFYRTKEELKLKMYNQLKKIDKLLKNGHITKNEHSIYQAQIIGKYNIE